MNYFWAFVTGGAICVVGQLFLDLTALTPARIEGMALAVETIAAQPRPAF